MRILKRFDTVWFDLGDTLIYFDGDLAEVAAESSRELARALARDGFDLDTDRFLEQYEEKINAYYHERDIDFIEHSTEQVLRILLSELGITGLTENSLKPALETMYAVSEAHWHLEDNAPRVLDALLQRGYRLGLISNASDSQNVQRLVDRCHLRPYFTQIYISADVGYRKPHPYIFKVALDGMQANPAQSVMVGDKLGMDVLGAYNAGMASIWLTRRVKVYDQRKLLYQITPDETISTLSELPRLLDNWAEDK